jgi:hypothetical protein
MTAARATVMKATQEWLTGYEAFSLIGVFAATLRRWSAAGDVQALTIPGGHRRFARSMILGSLPSARRKLSTLERLGETPEHMAGVYHRHVAQGSLGVSWLAGLNEDQLGPLRDHGRRIAGALPDFIDAVMQEERRSAILKADDAAKQYGRIAACGSVWICETVEAFLRYRVPLLGELAQVAHRRGLDTIEGTTLLLNATKGIDKLLVALMSGHEFEQARNTLVGGSS